MEYVYLALTKVNSGELPKLRGDTGTVETIISVVLGFIGAIALLVITVSGFRYVTSAGDPERASKAKNGIIYALVGLVVAIIAQAIVAFVVSEI